MATERELVALLHRAGWKQLSLTADMNAMFDFDLQLRQVNGHAPPPPDAADMNHGTLRGIHRLRGRLVIAPGGRYRVAPTEPADSDDEPVLGSLGPDALLYPVHLLSGYTLASHELVTMAGRDAFEVVATPRPWRASRSTPLDRIEAVVDAETGILLRRADVFAGQTLQLAELSQVRFGALDAADTAGFADDGDSECDEGDSSGGLGGHLFDDPGWKAVKAAANAAGAVFGTAVRHVPHDRSADAGTGAPGGRAAGDADAAMPTDEPFGVGTPAAADVISDELPYAMYRSGTAPFTGVLHRWTDMGALLDWLRSGANRRGWDGVGAFAGAVGDRMGTQHQVWRVQTGGGNRYRIDYVRSAQKGRPPRTMACDGEQRWRVYENRVTVGPAGPAEGHHRHGRRVVAAGIRTVRGDGADLWRPAGLRLSGGAGRGATCVPSARAGLRYARRRGRGTRDRAAYRIAGEREDRVPQRVPRRLGWRERGCVPAGRPRPASG
jgi:hypothetical protein